MTHSPRDDYAGAWWHLTNRGISKRAVYETVEDVKRFYDALESAVGRGLLEVHAFTLVTTHHHLLARSPVGEISAAMQIVGNRFVRWFNRTRRRDGSLYRGRFTGRRIDDPDYWCTVLRYIDLNPVRAGMCAIPSDHTFGSARAYRHGDAPAWLSKDEVLAALASHCDPGPPDRARYDEIACSTDPDANAFLVERLLSDPDRPAPPLRDLIRAASIHQQNWMVWKAALADAVAVGTAFLPPSASRRAAAMVARALSCSPIPGARTNVQRDVEAGLLRSASGLMIEEIAGDLGISRSTVRAAITRHEALMSDVPRYADLVARAVRSAVRRSLPPSAHSIELPRLVRLGAPELSGTKSEHGPK